MTTIDKSMVFIEQPEIVKGHLYEQTHTSINEQFTLFYGVALAFLYWDVYSPFFNYPSM